jgi:hypothetical protein
MDDSSVLIALLGIFSAVITAAFTMATWSQKARATTQDALVQVLKDQVAAEREEKRLISLDNREQAQTIAKLGVSVDKLTDQAAQTVRLLEDVVYGRETAAKPRRST